MQTALIALAFALNPAGVRQQPSERDIQVALHVEKVRIVVGEPVYVAYVVRNVSGRKLQILVGDHLQNTLDNPARLRISAVRQDGREAPAPKLPEHWVGNMMVGPQAIAPGKEYCFELLLPTYLPIREPGVYKITTRKLLNVIVPVDGKPYDWRDKGTPLETEASADLTVLPADSHALGEVIDLLGRRANADWQHDHVSQDDSSRAAAALATIADNRAVPWFAKLLTQRNMTSKLTALYALGRYDDPRALEAIKAGLATKASELEDTTTPQVAEQCLKVVRQAVGFALLKSPYKGSLEYLYSIRHDADEGIRLQAVHAAGERKDTRATAILREMTSDPAHIVSDEAARYLKLRGLDR